MFSFRQFAPFFCLLLLATRLPASQTVTLSWDANTELDVAGYHLYYGATADQFTQLQDVPTGTSADVSNLADGGTYFFVVTAYNTAGTESLFSNEVSYTAPGDPSPSPTPGDSPTPPPTPPPNLSPSPSPTPPATATPTPTPSATPIDTAITLSVTSRAVDVGGVVQVTLNNSMVNVNDIIALVPVGGTSPIDWFYLNGTKTPPQWGIRSTTVSFSMPRVGDYEFRYYSGSQILATSAEVSVTSGATTSSRNLSNVSTRAYVQTGDNVLIGGLIISGDTPKTVVIRGIGPSLASFGVTNALKDPTLSLHNAAGVVASNDNWHSSPNAAAISAAGLAPTNNAESAIMATLDPGAYTVVLSGVGGAKGIAVVEVYDVQSTSSFISNISTRGKIETGDKAMIGGFIIGGTQPNRVLIRALGPSLSVSGVTGVLSDPVLDLYDGNGSQIYSNDDWQSNQAQQIIDSTLAPADDREPAIIATLQPGSYTAIVRGAQNLTGIALVEVYNLTN